MIEHLMGLSKDNAKAIAQKPKSTGKAKKKYLHAQIHAMPLYAKFGFQAVGDQFEECAILHYKMELS
jgi:predicted GNAT family N-acyltransferase